MRRIKLIVAYDGTAYHGWQRQNNGVTVEEKLSEALFDLLGAETEITGASRTDSGVHALGNVAVFDTDSRIPGEKFAKALNVRLPEDIRVQESSEVPEDFHPRRVPCIKTYEYRILSRRIPLPMERLYSHFCYFRLDEERMNRAAAYLVGEHDYKSFCSPATQAETTVRTITGAGVFREGEMITVRVQGTGFLYNMVRIIAGTLIEVGRGAIAPEDIPEILKKRDRTAAGPTAPACGLCLMGIDYGNRENPGENRENPKEKAVDTA